MKSSLLMFAVAAVMMASTACTNEKIVYVEKEETTEGIELQPGEEIIKFSLSGNMSRAARPVASSENMCNVNTIIFGFYANDIYTDDGGKIVDVYNVYGETPKGVTYTGNKISLGDNYDFSTDLYIKISDLTPANKYHIYAYGYNATGNTDLSGVVFSNGMFTYTVPTEYQASRINHIDQEIFAGHVETVVNKHGLFEKDVELELTRQVAGLLAYMSEVPAYVLDDEGENRKVKTIKIETGLNGLTGIKFPEASDYNGVGNEASYSSAALLTFDVSVADNYEGMNAAAVGDVLTFGNAVNSPLLAKEMDGISLPAGFKCDANTLFGGCFLCPFNKDQSGIGEVQETLKIVYYDESGAMIKSIPLKTSQSGGSYAFNICRNNFYSIGTKKTIDNPEGETGKDEPLPIDPGSGIDHFGVTLDTSWSTLHDITSIE